MDALSKYFEILSKLTDTQLAYLPAVEWLLDNDSHRRTGRSALMATAFLRCALRYPGRWIKVSDHLPGVAQRRIIIQEIEGMGCSDENDE